jgi:hypothetical protein
MISAESSESRPSRDAGLDNQVWHNEQTAEGVSAPWIGRHHSSVLGNKAQVLALRRIRTGGRTR